MGKLNLKIITPEKVIFDSLIDSLYLTTSEGEIGILSDHEPLMAKVVPGEVRIIQDQKIRILASGIGIVQVSGDNISLLIDLAEDVKDIDEKVAEEARKRAEEAMEHIQSEEEYANTMAILDKAVAQLKIKRKHRF